MINIWQNVRVPFWLWSWGSPGVRPRLGEDAGLSCPEIYIQCLESGSMTFYLWWIDVNVPVFRIHIRIRIRIRRNHIFFGLSNPHPDPLVSGKDPRIRIRTKMSQTPNTVHKILKFTKHTGGQEQHGSSELNLQQCYNFLQNSLEVRYRTVAVSGM